MVVNIVQAYTLITPEARNQNKGGFARNPLARNRFLGFARRENNMTEDWTSARVSALIAYWEEGLTTSEIGRRLGVTKNAVIGKVHRLGLPKRRVSAAEKPKEVAVVTLDGLRAGMCSWPEGDPGAENFRFCAAPTVPGKPYCADHCAKAYVKGTKEKTTKAA